MKQKVPEPCDDDFLPNVISDHTPYIEEEDVSLDGDEDSKEMTWRSILQRLDQCCSNARHYFEYN